MQVFRKSTILPVKKIKLLSDGKGVDGPLTLCFMHTSAMPYKGRVSIRENWGQMEMNSCV
jgi:hypothetical protein